MSNNYSQQRIILFSKKEERDRCLVSCVKAYSSSPRLAEPYEGFNPVGDLCLSVWHRGNVKTAYDSKLLATIKSLTEENPELAWMGGHHIEGSEYCFDAHFRGVFLSFNEIDMIMMEDDETLNRTYSRWAQMIQKVFPPTYDTRPPAESEPALRSRFVRTMNELKSTQNFLHRAKSDTQIVAIFEIFAFLLQEVSNVYYQFETCSESASSKNVQLDHFNAT